MVLRVLVVFVFEAVGALVVFFFFAVVRVRVALVVAAGALVVVGVVVVGAATVASVVSGVVTSGVVASGVIVVVVVAVVFTVGATVSTVGLVEVASASLASVLEVVVVLLTPRILARTLCLFGAAIALRFFPIVSSPSVGAFINSNLFQKTKNLKNLAAVIFGGSVFSKKTPQPEWEGGKSIHYLGFNYLLKQ